jgi:phi13 family phage major tail protein
MANKVKYGLSNVYYAKATIDPSTGAATYDTPVAIKGAVNLSLDPQGELSPFYADNIKYYIVSNNSGYEGDLEIALIPDSFKKDILGEIEDDNGILAEVTDAPTQPFALLFQFEGDDSSTRHVMYNCTASRPTIAGATKEDSTEVQTETLNLSCASVFNASLNANVVKGKCLNSGASAATYATWNTAVYQPTVTP